MDMNVSQAGVISRILGSEIDTNTSRHHWAPRQILKTVASSEIRGWVPWVVELVEPFRTRLIDVDPTRTIVDDIKNRREPSATYPSVTFRYTERHRGVADEYGLGYVPRFHGARWFHNEE
jgi:hypothetical protein